MLIKNLCAVLVIASCASCYAAPTTENEPTIENPLTLEQKIDQLELNNKKLTKKLALQNRHRWLGHGWRIFVYTALLGMTTVLNAHNNIEETCQNQSSSNRCWELSSQDGYLTATSLICKLFLCAEILYILITYCAEKNSSNAPRTNN